MCEPIRYHLRGHRTILGNPIENVLEIGNGLIIEDQLHQTLQAKPIHAGTSLIARQQPAIGIGPASPYFGYLGIGQFHIPHMLDIVEQRAGSSILLAIRQFLDLAKRVFKQLCRNANDSTSAMAESTRARYRI
jgi:hypothetical protein